MTAAQAMPIHMQRNGFDPVPELAELRAGPGLERVRTMFGMDAWLVTRYADVREVLSDPARFSNSHVMSPGARPPGLPHVSPEEIERRRAGNLLAHDPPEHTRLRRMLTPEFTVRRMRRLEPRIREIVDQHLDAMQRHGPPVDLVAEFALPVPSLVICELLGVPYADRAEFQARSNRQLDLSFKKILRFGGQRFTGGLDIYNVMNQNTVLFYNTTFVPNVAGYLNANAYMNPRVFRLAAEYAW